MNDIRISIRRKYYLDTNFVLHLPYILSRVRPIRPKPNPPSFLVIADRNLLLKTRFQFQRLQEAIRNIICFSYGSRFVKCCLP